MNEQFLIGAILGSATFIFLGRLPAQRLLSYVRQRLPGSRD